MSVPEHPTVAALIDAAEPVEETLEESVIRLAAMSPLEYDRVRDSEAQRLGVRRATLDVEVTSARAVSESGPPADPAGGIVLSDAEPWPEPVDGVELLDELAATIRRYLVLPAGAAETITLWVLHAHLHATAAISPILAITSPSPECGKTTLLDLLGALVPRPLPASNITAAALFRAVEKWRPTMLVDEADTFLRDSDELRGVLNSGHRRSAAYVVRTVGDDHEPRQFRTWAPKAIALIGKLPATLASRAMEIELRRKTTSERVEPLRGDRLEHLEPIRRRCARFAVDCATEVLHADPQLPASLQGRAADNWRHLVAIADVAAGIWPERARSIAAVSAGSRAEETAGIQLLGDIRLIFDESASQRLPSKKLVDALGHMEDRPWPEWKNGSSITERQVARLLEPFKIRPTKFRMAGEPPGVRGYERGAFDDAFARYLPDTSAPSATPPQASETAIPAAFDPPQLSSGVADGDCQKANEFAGCGAVADDDADSGLPGQEDAWQALFDERAAAAEYDGGLSRGEAEAQAAAEVATLRASQSDGGDTANGGRVDE